MSLRKNRHIYIFVLAVLFFAFLLSQNYLAQYAWTKYRNADMAIFLTNDARLAMQIGNYYFNGGAYDLEKAEKAFQKAALIEPKILWGHYQLARIYFVKRDFSGAVEEINKELKYNPENLRSLYIRGLIYGFSGRHASAEEDFRRFVQWAPKEWAGYNDLAWILSSRGKYKEAKEVILKSFEGVSGGDKNPWLWNSLGVAQLNLKENLGAEKSFEKAQTLAEKLTPQEWVRAYPGNNPVEAEEGLASFLEAVKTNLERAQHVNN